MPFEKFIPNYLLLPYTGHEKVLVFSAFIDNILIVHLRHSKCKARPGIRFNNQTQSPEVLLISHNRFSNKANAENDIKCLVEINFQLAMIIVEEFGVLWGCSELNKTNHDEALIILAPQKKLFKNRSEYKTKGLELLQNKSLITEKDINDSSSFVITTDSEMAERSAHCDNFKCDSYYLSFIVLGVLFSKFGIFVAILIFKYHKRNNLIGVQN